MGEIQLTLPLLAFGLAVLLAWTLKRAGWSKKFWLAPVVAPLMIVPLLEVVDGLGINDLHTMIRYGLGAYALLAFAISGCLFIALLWTSLRKRSQVGAR